MKDVDKMIQDIVEDNSLIKVNDQLYLKKYQIEILDLYHIAYQNCSSISEILFLIDEVLESESDDVDALDEVARDLQEFHYYHNTNK